MLSGRFRTLATRLSWMLQALVERGRMASAAVAAIVATVAVRQLRLETLMDRFAAGKLRVLTVRAGARASRPGAAGPTAGPPRLWPEHRARWLDLVGRNNPSLGVRTRWMRWDGNQAPAMCHMAEFSTKLRALIEEDAEMRALLGVSREARRLVRWFLRTSDDAALPAALAEPRRRRPRRPRAIAQPRSARDAMAPARAPGPFETNPDNLTREERETRGLWVPPPIMLFDAAAIPFTPTEWQRRKTWMDR